MDTFFEILKKSLVATIFVAFTLVATYIPQDWNEIETVHAGGGGLGGGSTEFTQILNNTELLGVNIQDTLSAGYNLITSGATFNDYTKEFFLDAIAWYAAKTVVNLMVKDLVNWINSGFAGKPMFIQNLKKFLTDVADAAIGTYVAELGEATSFLCDPFKLDIRVAISMQYYQLDKVNQPAPKCTLTGIINNIEGFTSGVQGSFSQGGWNDWFDITSRPAEYTPYGAVLAAQSGSTVRVLNTKAEAASKLEWGAGFLSGEICNTINAATGEQDCSITKPGKIIEEALSFNIDSERQSLITADEFNEVIAALISQLAKKALTGAAGLLGV